MIDFRLATFLTVCRYMNFTRAAEALHLTQPAVSQHIKHLEKVYAAPLFVRDKKRLALTPAGVILRDALETTHSDEAILRRRMQDSMAGAQVLTFGVTRTIGEYAILDPLARLIKAHPHSHFRIRYGNTQTLLAGLHEGSIDFAIVEGYFNAAQYGTQTYRSEEYIAAAAANHAFARPVRRLRDLTGERLLLREPGSGTREILVRALALQNLSLSDFSPIVEVENIHTIVALLRQDCGISFLYKAAVEEDLERGILRQIPLEDFSVQHDFTFIWNRGSIFSKDFQSIFQALQ